MKHFILEGGDIINAADHISVQQLSGTLTAVANNASRTLFCFRDAQEGFTLHLDRDCRPASRLLQLLSGAIAYNLREAVLVIRSEKREGARGQSRLRLVVQDTLIPAPEVMPERGERVANNRMYLDAICTALGVVAQVVDTEEGTGAGVAVGCCGRDTARMCDALGDDDIGTVVVRDAVRPCAGAEDEGSSDEGLIRSFASAARRARRNGTAISRGDTATIIEVMARQVKAYNDAASRLGKALEVCLEAVGGSVVTDGGTLSTLHGGVRLFLSDDCSTPFAPSAVISAQALQEAFTRAFDNIEEC